MAGAGTVARAQEPRPKQIEILFATDRAAPVAGAKIAFGHAAGETITFGKAVVMQKAGAQPIPLDRFALHRRNAPPVYDVAAFDIVSLSILDRTATIALAADFAFRAERYGRKILVFVHGFNTAFTDAVRRAAQISLGLGFDGPVVLFSWPSRGQFWSYDGSEGSSEQQQDVLTLPR